MSRILLSLIPLLFMITGCTGEHSMTGSIAPSHPSMEENTAFDSHAAEGSVARENQLTFSVDGTSVAVKWEENESVATLVQLAEYEPLTIHMERYGGFEQVGILSKRITSNDTQMTAEPGDIVLYSGNSLVVFYGFNTWAYTKLGHIEGLSVEELENILDHEQVTVTLSAVQNER